MDGDTRAIEEQQAAQFAAKIGVPYSDTRDITQTTILPHLSLEALRQFGVAPLHQYSDTSYELGLTDVTDRTKLPELQKLAPGIQLTFKTVSKSGFNDLLNRAYYQMFEAERGGDFEAFGAKLEKSAPKLAFRFIAQLAFWLEASDIHIEPQAGTARIRFRLDGILHPITTVGLEAYKVFLSDLQTQAEIKWGSDVPQSGRISYPLMNNQAIIETVNMRIETIPALHGEEIVVRIFNENTQELHLDGMGFTPEQITRIESIAAHPNGMILAVGPTGSGKTSTLYALLNQLNNPEIKIITLEDPVEYDLSGITQIPVKTEDKELFAEKLRAVMREDPNVVMIGEIRDVDTAKTALQAALTGHLVLSTFHASNASAAITRMLDMIGENPLFASAVRLIIAQRLVRRICTHCAEEVAATKSEMEFLQKAIASLPKDRKPTLNTNLTLKHGKGCAVCHGLGYKGRIAIIEMMVITPDVEKIMTTYGKTTAQDIEAVATKGGMITLLEDGLKKALAGTTTLEEVMTVTEI